METETTVAVFRASAAEAEDGEETPHATEVSGAVRTSETIHGTGISTLVWYRSRDEKGSIIGKSSSCMECVNKQLSVH